MVRIALRWQLAHLIRISSGRAATAGIKAGASSLDGLRLNKHAPEVLTTPKTCFLKVTISVVFGIRRWIAKEMCLDRKALRELWEVKWLSNYGLNILTSSTFLSVI